MCEKKVLVKSRKGILPSLLMEADLNKLRNVSWLERRLRLVISTCRCQNTQRMCSGIIDGSFVYFHILLFQLLKFIFCLSFFFGNFSCFFNIFLYEFDIFICNTSESVLV